MRIATTGKGGAGKSTLAVLLARALHARGHTVLAIDADHNMDTLYQLAGGADLPHYLGTAMTDVSAYAGTPVGGVGQAFMALLGSGGGFALSPADSFTKKYAPEMQPGLRLMASGPHTSDVLENRSCSHILSTPLKAYLPLLRLQPGEYAVIDEKAGADGPGTGELLGADVALVVTDKSPAALRAAQGIIALLGHFGIPHAVVANKVANEGDVAEIRQALGTQVLGALPLCPSLVAGIPSAAVHTAVDELLDNIHQRFAYDAGAGISRTLQRYGGAPRVSIG